MSEVAICYGTRGKDGLKDAEKSSKAVAKKLDAYDDELTRKVYNKLHRYPGDFTANISSALQSMQSKSKQLKDDEEKYKDYATAIDDLREQCEDVDSGVAKRIKTLSADFKAVYDISTNCVVDAINELLYSIQNKSSFLRKAQAFLDDLVNKKDELKAKIKNWYNFKGGEDLVKGVATAILDIAIVIVGVVATVATLGTASLVVATIVAVALGISTGIALCDSIQNITNEVAAYQMHQSDPAQAKRLHNQNTVTDTMRGNAMSDIANTEKKAAMIDATKLVSDGILAIYSINGMRKTILKWGGGSTKSVGIKITDSIKDSLSSVKKTVQMQGMKGGMQTALKSLGKDFHENFKFNYLYKKRNEFDASKNLKYKASCFKNWFGSAKVITNLDFSKFSIKQLEIGDYLKSNKTVFTYNDGLECKTISDMESAGKKIINVVNTPSKLEDVFKAPSDMVISIPTFDYGDLMPQIG